VAKAKLKYLVQFGLNAYFSHKADEYGVYFFDPFYYENTEPFHESLKQCSLGKQVTPGSKTKLAQLYFSSQGIKDQFKLKQHSAYLISISKQPGLTILTNKTGVIISMINNQYGFIKFGDSGETALFCCKSLFKDGWLFSGDPLRLPAMKFDGYKIPGGGMTGDQAYSWYAVLVWCGRRPSPKFCSTAEDLNSTPVFRDRRLSSVGDGKRLRQPSSSMMVGQVMEIRRNGAVLKVREDSLDKVFVPGWMRQMSNSEGKWLSTLSGECIGMGDLVAYYLDTQETKPGYAAVGKNVMVLKESGDKVKGKESRRRRRRQSTELSAGARYEVGGDTTEDEHKTGTSSSSRRRRSKKKLAAASVETSATEETDSDEDVTDGELEWLEKDLQTIIDKEDPQTKTLKLLKDVHTKLNITRGSKKQQLRRTGIKNLRGGYKPLQANSEDFWRMKRMLAKVEAYYQEDNDPDYLPGMEVEQVTRPRTISEADTSFTSATTNRSRRSRKSSLASVSTIAASKRDKNSVVKRPLPYWITAISKQEKYDPELEKFVAEDKFYKEDNDPDYSLPNSDVEVSESEEEEEEEDVSVLEAELMTVIPEELKEGKHRETPKKVTSPVKVTLTPSKEGEQEPETEVVNLSTESEEIIEDDIDEVERKPELWETSLLLTEQPDEYDSEEDPEYFPDAVIVDPDLEYDEYPDGEDVIPDEEVKELLEDAGKDPESLAPRCYIPIWVAVESPAERIERAKEQLASLAISKVEADTSSKDTDSNGKKEELPGNKMLNGLGAETGLTPQLRKMSVGSKPEDLGNDGSPKTKRERRKSKTKSESKDEKTADEEAQEPEAPKTPTKASASGDDTSPVKKASEMSSKIPVKIIASDQQETTTEEKQEDDVPVTTAEE